MDLALFDKCANEWCKIYIGNDVVWFSHSLRNNKLDLNVGTMDYVVIEAVRSECGVLNRQISWNW